jgi:Rad3-related DNA helicase
LTPKDIFGLGGVIARRLESYELRREQLEMSEAINMAFIAKSHLLVEAGTGVGKSFAYLVPAILQTAGNQNASCKSSQKSDQIDVTAVDLPKNETRANQTAINVTINNRDTTSTQSDSNTSFIGCIVGNNFVEDSGKDIGDVPFDAGDSSVTGDQLSDQSIEQSIEQSIDQFVDQFIDHSIPFDESYESELGHDGLCDQPASPPRVVISTHTISLQEQIIEKDVPFLRSVLPFEFTAVLVKGRSNYVCRRRFLSASQKQTSLFDEYKQLQFARIKEWVSKTDDGSKSSLVPEPDWDIWAEICCETGNCSGRHCGEYKNCFYNNARRRVANAQILIVNHALFFSDLALRMQSGSILPSYDMLVFDEAHTIEQVASDHLGLSVSQYQVEYNLHRLFNEQTNKGLLAGGASPDKTAEDNILNMFNDKNSNSKKAAQVDLVIDYADARAAVNDCMYRTADFFGDITDWLQSHPGSNGRVREIMIVKNTLAEGLNKLIERLRRVIEKLQNPSERQELIAAKERITAIRQDVEVWLLQSLPSESVYWIDVQFTTRGQQRISINASPVDIGPILREQLFGKIKSVIMTSATLTTGNTF